MNLYKFTSTDGYELSVKDNFLLKCSVPEKENIEELFDQFSVYLYLHSVDGYALQDKMGMVQLYFIDGRMIEEKNWEAARKEYNEKEETRQKNVSK